MPVMRIASKRNSDKRHLTENEDGSLTGKTFINGSNAAFFIARAVFVTHPASH
jgi:hypothetical protein